MWSGSGRGYPQNPPPYWQPPADPAGSLYPQVPYHHPEPAGNVPVLSHHGVPSPFSSSSAPASAPPMPQPSYGMPPPAGSVPLNYPYAGQQQPMSGNDEWIQVYHMAQFPYGSLVRAMDRPLNGTDQTTRDSYVALWSHHGEPVFGRAWNKNGKVEAWFPHGGKEHHSGSSGSFTLLAYNGPPRQNFRYAWVTVNQLNSMCQPVRQQEYSPVVIPDVHIGSFRGELLGKGNLSRRMAWVSYGGKEHHFDGHKFNQCYVLCRVPL